MNTTKQLLDLLNRKPMTIGELSEAVNLTRNSVHVQVTRLLDEGKIVETAPRTQSSAGKPARQYQTAQGGEDAFSSAHKIVLEEMISTLKDGLPASTRLKLLKNTGKAMAKSAGMQPSGNLQNDIERCVSAVNNLGALAESGKRDGLDSIECFSCPVASLVRKDSATCQLVAAFFSEATGHDVDVKCKVSDTDTVVCGFTFTRCVPGEDSLGL